PHKLVGTNPYRPSKLLAADRPDSRLNALAVAQRTAAHHALSGGLPVQRGDLASLTRGKLLGGLQAAHHPARVLQVSTLIVDDHTLGVQALRALGSHDPVDVLAVAVHTALNQALLLGLLLPGLTAHGLDCAHEPVDQRGGLLSSQV